MKEGQVTETVIPVESWPDLTAKEAQVYWDQQIPYPNYASNEELAARAVNLYRSAKTKCETITSSIRENWRWIDWLFRANSLRRTSNRDVHVPELLKAHRALVPRIVEAFFGNGQAFFAAKGFDANDRRRELAVTALLDFQLEQNDFRSMMAPYASSLCKYQVGCWKVSWERKVEKIVFHSMDRSIDEATGQLVERHRREMKEVVTFEGNRIRLVDPARMIIDAQRWDVKDLAYIGDVSKVPLHEVLDNPAYLNKDELIDKMHDGGHSIGDKVAPTQAARSGLRIQPDQDTDQEPKDTAEFIDIGELWCWFNWAPEAAKRPDMRKTVITVAEDHTCLRLQENFHDDKHLPYAISRYSDNGLEFFDVGLYDPALRVQDEIDHLRGTVYEAADLILAPRAFTKGPAVDLPNSMYDMPAGWIGKDVGDIVFAPVPNTLQTLPMLDHIMRRDVEEITGVTRLWQGTDDAAVGNTETATAVRRKIEESNRRLLGLIRSLDHGMTALLKIMHANNQQFLPDKTKFRILNDRLAKELGESEHSMEPSELLGPVDFKFFGVTRIQQYGLRGTNLLTFMQVMAPFMQEQPQEFNLRGISRQVFGALVGEEVDDEILSQSSDLTTMSDQTVENYKLVVGQRVAVHPEDDDEDHLAKMDEVNLRQVAENPETPRAVRAAITDHYEKHAEQLLEKQARARAMAQRAQQRAILRGEATGQEGNGSPPPAGGMERGRQQTNGDGTEQQVARAGRRGPIPEGRNGG